MKIKNLAIDIDGTLLEYPEFFIELGKFYKSLGRKVYIITGNGLDGVNEKKRSYPNIFTDDWYDEIIDTSRYNKEEKNLLSSTTRIFAIFVPNFAFMKNF